MNNILMYSKPGCHYCELAKRYLATKNMAYEEVQLGKDITREEFVATFPDVKSVPFFVINGEKVKSYDELCERYNQPDRSFLAE